MTDFLDQLAAIIADRRAAPREGSYTSSLFADGLPRMVQKVGEEGVEVVIAALAQSRERQVEEMSDLLFHLLVLMQALGISLDDLRAELERRHK